MGMMATMQRLRVPPRLDSLIDAIGEHRFESELIRFLDGLFHVDHYALFALDGAAPQEISALSRDGSETSHKHASLYLKTELWRRDPTMAVARQASDSHEPGMIYLDVNALPDRELRETIYPLVNERLLLCGHSIVGRIGLSMLRTSGRSAPALHAEPALHELGPILLSILSKHMRARRREGNIRFALSRLEDIQARVAASAVKLPPREIQVCARLLYGVSTVGIALKLDIGEETVITYRKRIYSRLGIGSQRELVIWYLSLLDGDDPHDPAPLDHFKVREISAIPMI